MSERHGWIGIVVASIGIATCVLAIVGFFRKIVSNGLPFHAAQSPREHYLAVGRAYSNGFLAGFFLCFFLVLAALAGSTVLSHYRARSARRRDWARQPLSFPKRGA